MSNIKKHTILNNESTVRKGQRFLLEYKHDNLVPCTVEEHEDDFDFLFNMDKLFDYSSAMDKPLEEKYRLLYNCGELESLSNEYEFSLSPDNLALDDSLRPKVLVRDIGKMNDDFINKYQALCASTLHPKYSYEDYLEGGKDLLTKNKSISWINDADSTDDMKEHLYQLYKQKQESVTKSKTMVGKTALRALWTWGIILSAVAIGCAVLLYYAFADQLPKKNSYISASNAYLAQNYEGVINAYSQRDIEDITLEGKYMLARAFVASESLTAEQKEWVLQGLTLKTEVPILDFWIEVGRLNFTDAIDIAQRINDDELLLFAYIKQSVALENDTTLTGEEKTTQLQAIESKIEKLSQEMTENGLAAQD